MAVAKLLSAGGIPIPGIDRVNAFDQTTSVASGSPTDIVSYTVPLGKSFFFDYAQASTDAAGTVFEVVIDGDVEARQRAYWSDFDKEFWFFDQEFAAGTTITIRGTHQRPFAAAFDARIVGVLQ